MMISPHVISRVGSPMPMPAIYSQTPHMPSAPFDMSPRVADFQIERAPTRSRRASFSSPSQPTYDNELLLRDSVSRLLASKSHTFSISGNIPLDASQLVLFFRTNSGITHSLDFPIDIDYNTPPAFNVLITACRPHQTSDLNDYAEHESLFYPPNLPLTTSLELENHPIMDAVRDTLFPSLPAGHYLVATKDKLEVLVTGSRLGLQSRGLRNDGRVATISITLPVRYRGGALVVRDVEGEEKFFGAGGKSGDIEWTAFLADCEYEVETVQKGCRMSILYAVFLKTFGPTSVIADPLINPSDKFLDLVSPVLNASRGRKIAFYLSNSYGVNPSEVLAESLVPYLKGGDSVLYHAIKLYKLVPELHWYAGGYIWPVDGTVEFPGYDSGVDPRTTPERMPISMLSSQQRTPALRGAFSTPYGGSEVGSDADNIRSRVEHSGAIPIADAEISILTDWNTPNPIVGKERVPFVSGGELDKLVVNVLIVVYVA